MKFLNQRGTATAFVLFVVAVAVALVIDPNLPARALLESLSLANFVPIAALLGVFGAMTIFVIDTLPNIAQKYFFEPRASGQGESEGDPHAATNGEPAAAAAGADLGVAPQPSSKYPESFRNLWAERGTDGFGLHNGIGRAHAALAEAEPDLHAPLASAWLRYQTLARCVVAMAAAMAWVLTLEIGIDFPSMYGFKTTGGGELAARLALWWVPCLLALNFFANFAANARREYWTLLENPDADLTAGASEADAGH